MAFVTHRQTARGVLTMRASRKEGDTKREDKVDILQRSSWQTARTSERPSKEPSGLSTKRSRGPSVKRKKKYLLVYKRGEKK